LARLRFLPLYLALESGRRAALLLQRFGGRYRFNKPREIPAWRPGLSIIIPECGTPELLRRALSSAIGSSAHLDEESELIVIVNGATPSLYDEHRREFPLVRWLHFREALGYAGAIEKGVCQARFDWVYLLNSDMSLDAGALGEVARWRAPHVFAVSSQVFFADPERRREETGWTNYRIGNDGAVELFDALPEDASTVRGHLYAGGGNSLFRRDLLRMYLPGSQHYNPVYWEDVEWGVRAWRAGYEVLFCPTSRAVHVHRATVSRLFSPCEADRIWKRNQFLFSIRNGFNESSNRTTIRHLRSAFDLDTQRELIAIRQAVSIFRSLVSNARAPVRHVDLSRVSRKYYLRPGAPLP
jgi:GT2 family glycosyltransferase